MTDQKKPGRAYFRNGEQICPTSRQLREMQSCFHKRTAAARAGWQALYMNQPPAERPIDDAMKIRIKAIQEEHGLGLHQAKMAIEIGAARFGGDDAKGGLWIHANALAVHVKGGPRAREKWNDEYVERNAK